MHTPPLLTPLLMVAAQAAALYILSRLIFVWAIQAFSDARPASLGGRLLLFLRLPGNLVHEASHALGFFIGGYRVRRCVLCIFDKTGRGSCEPGRPWSPLAVPWIATGVAALLPLVCGALALRYLAGALGVDLHPQPLRGATLGAALVHNLIAYLNQLDLTSWRAAWPGLLFLYLAFSIGAELAPSDVDLRRSLPAVAVATALLLALVVSFGALDGQSAAREWFEAKLGRGVAWLSALLDFGLAATLLAGAAAAIPALLVRVMRSA